MSQSTGFLNSTLMPNTTLQTTLPAVARGSSNEIKATIARNYQAIVALNMLFNLIALIVDICVLKGIVCAKNFSEGTRVFLANMTVIDLIIAISLQPIFSAFLIMWMTDHTSRMLFDFLNALHYILIVSSFLSFLTVSLDRYLLIYLPFTYCNMMDTKIAMAICGVLNMMALGSFLVLKFNATQRTVMHFLNAIMCVIVVLLILIHARIMFTARKMHKKIRQNSTIDMKQTVLRRRRVEMKQAGLTFGLFLTIIVCYLPLIVVQSVLSFRKVDVISKILLTYWCVFIMLVCPIFKQILLCVMNNAIREAIKKWICKTTQNEAQFALRSLRNTNATTQNTSP